MAAKPKRKPVDEPAVVPDVQGTANTMVRLAGRFRKILRLTEQTLDGQVFEEALQRLETLLDEYRSAFKVK